MGVAPMDDDHDLHVMLTHQGHIFQNGTKSRPPCAAERGLLEPRLSDFPGS